MTLGFFGTGACFQFVHLNPGDTCLLIVDKIQDEPLLRTEELVVRKVTDLRVTNSSLLGFIEDEQI